MLSMRIHSENLRRATGACFVLAMALTGVVLTELPGATQSRSSVRGQVFEHGGWRSPLPDIRVQLLDASDFEVVASRKTDTHGEYEFAGVPADDYFLRFTDPQPCRDQPAASAQREIERSRFRQPIVGVNVYLREGSSVGGVVTDGDGQPLAGVRVRVADAGQALTVEDGSWLICRLSAGTYDVAFRNGGRTQIAEDVRLDEGEHVSVPMGFSSQVSVASVSDDTEVLGIPVVLQQATGTPTATASPSPTPTPTQAPRATVAPGSDDDLPETGIEVLVLGTIGTWTLFLGMLLVHVATRRAERLRSLDGYL